MRTAVDLYQNPTKSSSSTIQSSRGSSKASGGGGPQLNGPEGDVAFADAGQAEWTDPRLPGSLCARGERRVAGFAPHQGRHAGWRTGMTITRLLLGPPTKNTAASTFSCQIVLENKLTFFI